MTIKKKTWHRYEMYADAVSGILGQSTYCSLCDAAAGTFAAQSLLKGQMQNAHMEREERQ